MSIGRREVRAKVAGVEVLLDIVSGFSSLKPPPQAIVRRFINEQLCSVDVRREDKCLQHRINSGAEAELWNKGARQLPQYSTAIIKSPTVQNEEPTPWLLRGSLLLAERAELPAWRLAHLRLALHPLEISGCLLDDWRNVRHSHKSATIARLCGQDRWPDVQ